MIVSEILYYRNLIYYLRSTICNHQTVKKLRLLLSKKSNFLLNLSSWVHNLGFTGDLLLIAVTKKVFQGFPKFLRSEYLIFQSVNKALFTLACSLLDNSFCLCIAYIFILIICCQECFQTGFWKMEQSSHYFICSQKFSIQGQNKLLLYSLLITQLTWQVTWQKEFFRTH